MSIVNDYTIKQIDYHTAMQIVIAKHYLHRKCILLFPTKSYDAININHGDDCRNDILKQLFHPWFHLKTDSGISLFDEIIPAPAKLVAAKECEYKRTEGKDVGGNKEVP